MLMNPAALSLRSDITVHPQRPAGRDVTRSPADFVFYTVTAYTRRTTTRERM